MKITIENTDKIVTMKINGADVPARIWEGSTESGVPVHCFVTRISPQTHDEDALAVFERELMEQRAPIPEGAAIPLRFIL